MNATPTPGATGANPSSAGDGSGAGASGAGPAAIQATTSAPTRSTVGRGSLVGRTALITGSTQGIGRAIAEALADEGATILLHDHLPDEDGAPHAAALAARHQVARVYLRADLRHPAAAAGLVPAALAQGLRPDIVVNNAGIQFTAPVEAFPVERWDEILAVNLSAAFLVMRAAVPVLREAGWGRIVNIASVHGLVASIHKAAYLASKHGLVGLSKGVALETAGDPITVNCVCPGWTDTPILGPQIAARATRFEGDLARATADLVREKQPNGRLLPPQRIGQIVAFLCSDAAEGITGTALPVDGGWTAQ